MWCEICLQSLCRLQCLPYVNQFRGENPKPVSKTVESFGNKNAEAQEDDRYGKESHCAIVDCQDVTSICYPNALLYAKT